jgi:hypothetical protein
MSVFNFMESFFFISLGITFLLIIMLVYHFKQRIMALEHKHDTMFEIVNNIVKQLRNMQMNIQHLGESKPFIITQPVFEPVKITEPAPVMIEDDEDSDDDDEDSDDDDEDSHDEDEDSDDDDEDSHDEIPVEINKETEPMIQEDEILIRKSDGSVTLLDESTPALDESTPALDESTRPVDTKDKYKKMPLAALKTAAVEKGLVTDASKMKKPELLKLLEADNE